jgi:hypothetical protein
MYSVTPLHSGIGHAFLNVIPLRLITTAASMPYHQGNGHEREKEKSRS